MTERKSQGIQGERQEMIDEILSPVVFSQEGPRIGADGDFEELIIPKERPRSILKSVTSYPIDGEIRIS